MYNLNIVQTKYYSKGLQTTITENGYSTDDVEVVYGGNLTLKLRDSLFVLGDVDFYNGKAPISEVTDIIDAIISANPFRPYDGNIEHELPDLGMF